MAQPSEAVPEDILPFLKNEETRKPEDEETLRPPEEAKINPKSTEQILPKTDVQQAAEENKDVWFFIHEVTPYDTLEGISIRYDIHKDLIRKANDFTGDDVYIYKTLKIPKVKGPKFILNEDIDHEAARKSDAIETLGRIISEAYQNDKQKVKMAYCFKEAKYYLETFDYNFESALQEFEGDLKFEQEEAKKLKTLKKLKIF